MLDSDGGFESGDGDPEILSGARRQFGAGASVDRRLDPFQLIEGVADET